jgi:pimeloyl-ACP methyl ester carboxylesterase
MNHLPFKPFRSVTITVALLLSGCASATLAPTLTPAPTLSLAPTPLPTRSPARFDKADCAVFNPTGTTNNLPNSAVAAMDCGYLSVPEDRAQTNSPLIQLAVVIVKSTSSNPAPDPVVFLAGGPGVHVVESLAGFSLLNDSAFTDILSHRDLVFFDQRGVGHSRPPLDCPEMENQAIQDLPVALSRADRQQHFLQAAQACHDRLIREGRHLSAYTSAASAADVNDLRLALGYASWNLLGISYGTRLALTIMRDFPAGVRSALLDSVYPPQVAADAEGVGDAELAFNLLFDSCAADAGCQAAYPDLKKVFYDMVAQLDTQPMTLTVTRPQTGQAYADVITGDGLIGLFYALLHSTDALPYLPRLIYDLRAGRSQYFDSPVQAVLDGFAFQSDGFSAGMHYSVQCGEETSFTSPAAVATTIAPVFPRLREAFDIDGVFALCATWDVRPAASIENQAVVSDIPTLILAGANDPTTPPAWGRLAAQSLSRSHFFEFPWVGHVVLGAGPRGSCSRSIVSALLAEPLAVPDAACLAQFKVFFVTQ